MRVVCCALYHTDPRLSSIMSICGVLIRATNGAAPEGRSAVMDTIGLAAMHKIVMGRMASASASRALLRAQS